MPLTAWTPVRPGTYGSAATRARMSQISWRTTVAHQPTEDIPCLSRASPVPLLAGENFHYVFF